MKVYNNIQKGETIVEVLISIAILSAVLGGAFAVSGRSQKTIQANDERYQAQVYANEQADLLRTIVNNDETTQALINSYTNPSNPFCVSGAKNITKQFTYSVGNNTEAKTEGCVRNNGIDYNILVYPRPDVITGVTDSFIIKIQWESLISSSGYEEITVGYGI